jgi:Rap guanine nucleotide exchange factor 2
MASVQSSLDADEVDLSGLIESIVDSDEEEDLAESMDVSDNYSDHSKVEYNYR